MSIANNTSASSKQGREMKVEAYVLNTYDEFEDWHRTSLTSLNRYFTKHGITLKVMTKDDYYVRQMLDHNIDHHPFLRKFLRVYSFLNSGADVGIFIDLDTVVLKLEKDIKELLSTEKNFMHWRMIDFGEHQDRPWLKIKTDIMKGYFGEDEGQFINTDTGFAVYTREFCENMIQYLNSRDLDIRTKSGQLHCQSLDIFHGKDRRIINDEHLLTFFMQKDKNYEKHIVEPPCNYMGKYPNNKICSSTYNIGDSLYPSDPDFHNLPTWSMQRLCKHDCIFHHLLGWKMSKILVPYFVEVFKK